ncbi:uncharacterized protein BDV17DRAFT_71531 [Aspergillus undulatus]|uniref:uncharacterized protein n=1 Tax=Aspergillus undulatus TaxID=1810928 RepID=UPI003CCD9046
MVRELILCLLCIWPVSPLIQNLCSVCLFAYTVQCMRCGGDCSTLIKQTGIWLSTQSIRGEAGRYTSEMDNQDISIKGFFPQRL